MVGGVPSVPGVTYFFDSAHSLSTASFSSELAKARLRFGMVLNRESDLVEMKEDVELLDPGI
jgi:hypothetical protein